MSDKQDYEGLARRLDEEAYKHFDACSNVTEAILREASAAIRFLLSREKEAIDLIKRARGHLPKGYPLLEQDLDAFLAKDSP